LEATVFRRIAVIALAAALAGTSALHAQEANPLSATLKGSWANVRDLISKMAEKMPEENYRFKPTPDVQDFGVRMAHAIQFMMRGCAQVKGEQKALTFSNPPTRAEAIAAMKETSTYCDAVFNGLTDADAMKMVTGGRGPARPAFAILEGNVLEHSQEMYGYMAVYLRLKGIVPPSSDRNER
jgi:DinB superfamily